MFVIHFPFFSICFVDFSKKYSIISPTLKKKKHFPFYLPIHNNYISKNKMNKNLIYSTQPFSYSFPLHLLLRWRLFNLLIFDVRGPRVLIRSLFIFLSPSWNYIHLFDFLSRDYSTWLALCDLDYLARVRVRSHRDCVGCRRYCCAGADARSGSGVSRNTAKTSATLTSNSRPRSWTWRPPTSSSWWIWIRTNSSDSPSSIPNSSSTSETPLSRVRNSDAKFLDPGKR